MTFVFPILLGGLVIAGVPILLHLILRQKPKTLPFPAFRFLVQKHRSNLRKLQLRHLLLLILRITLIAALCLALAQPRLFHERFNLSRERPVAAILVFDTSPTMDYQSSDKVSRLDEAKKRGKELFKELPDGSRILVLDTADAAVSDRGDWLLAPSQVRQRIDSLKIKPVNGPALRGVEQALRLFQTAAHSEDETLRKLPRLLCVFSDRTVGSWPGGKREPLHDLADQLPATLEGVQQLRSTAAPLIEMLKSLRAKLPPPAGKDYPEQALVESLSTLRDRAAGLQREELHNDAALHQLLVKTKRETRELRDTLTQIGEQKPADIEEFRGKVLTSLHGLLRHLTGVQMLYLDVGVEQPVDVALLKIELPSQSDGRMQQLFAADEKFIVRVVMQALGKDVSTTVLCKIGKEELKKQVDLKAGEQSTVPFEIDLAKLNLGVGAQTLEVKLASKDALESNNQLFAAFQIRQPKRVLVLTDDKAKARFFADALTFVGYRSEIKTIDALPAIEWGAYDAAYLFELASPSAELWRAAQAYVQKGGNVAIVPGRNELKPEAYHQPVAQAVLPVTWKKVVEKDAGPGAVWDLAADRVYQHPLLKPYRSWFESVSTDFVVNKRWAHKYWLLEPVAKKAGVIVTYADEGAPPALVERMPEGSAGKVIAFTTPIDDLLPAWNNYQEKLTSFPLALAMIATRYLTGEDKGVNLNFQCGVEEPHLPLPVAPRYGVFKLNGPDLIETLTAEPDANELRIKEARLPGNYTVEGQVAAGQPGTPLGSFSVNLPPEENDLTRLPAAEIESLFGNGAVVTAERGANLRELLKGQWSEPLELFPYLMVLLLFVLALENLLANKFYKRED